MDVTNIVKLTGRVDDVYVEKMESRTELRFNFHTIADHISDAYLVCICSFEKDEKLPSVRKGMWLSVEGTLRMKITEDKLHQCYVLVTQLNRVPDRAERKMRNQIMLTGIFAEPEGYQVRDDSYRGAFKVYAPGSENDKIYAYTCVAAKEKMLMFRIAEQIQGPVIVTGKLLFVYKQSGIESSAIVITDNILPADEEYFEQKMRENSNILFIELEEDE